MGFEEKYPGIAAWVKSGWIEIGYADGSTSFIRVLDEGGMVWEGKRKYPTMDAALEDAEKGINAWLGK